MQWLEVAVSHTPTPMGGGQPQGFFFKKEKQNSRFY
jgi:hypothetical protein